MLFVFSIIYASYSSDCGKPSTPTDGSVAFNSTSYQSEAIYSCDNGYTLVGEATRKCLINGTWSNTDPVCQIKGINGIVINEVFSSIEFQVFCKN